MSLTVAPTVSRGSALSLQPFYYASSLFVDPMREDISTLLVAFVTAYAREPLEPEKPFELFKTIWKDQGWELVHLKVLDARAREVFLWNVMRLLVGTYLDISSRIHLDGLTERMEPDEHSLIRVGALFALYTFYKIQPESLDINLQSVQYITLTLGQPIAFLLFISITDRRNLDSYEKLLEFPGALRPPLRVYVTYIISQLLSLEVFHIIPHTSLYAHNPRTLPHTIPLLTRDIDHGHKKKTGRPSQLTQSQRADKALSELEAFNSPLPLDPPTPNEYLVLKEQLRTVVSSEALKEAETLTMERIQAAEKYVRDKNLPLDDREGLERLKNTVTQSSGLLGLLQQDKD
jgi:Small nuclear RNA activating complex (SNAPc), subunit 1